MHEFKATIPTYNGASFAEQVGRGELPEHGEPTVRVLIRAHDALRVVLGSHDHNDLRTPDLWIERHPRGWLIALHAAGGGDPAGLVYMHDDTRCFIKPAGGSMDDCVVLESGDPVPGFDPDL